MARRSASGVQSTRELRRAQKGRVSGGVLHKSLTPLRRLGLARRVKEATSESALVQEPKQVVVIGTAHVSQQSADAVTEVIKVCTES